MQNALTRLEFPELFFGIASPIGVEIQTTIEALIEYLTKQSYDVVPIRVTDYFQTIKRAMSIDLDLYPNPTDARLDSYIAFGNRVREEFKDNSVLAAYAILQVTQNRDRTFRRRHTASYQKRAYILHQFKRKEEIDLLRNVYGRLFFQISVYSDRESRISFLAKRIAHEKNLSDYSNARATAIRLIATDELEKGTDHGQTVSKIFHDADLIINKDLIEVNTVARQVHRFCELLFSSNSISPTRYEYGMFAAKAAALRTLDLSRQVGAAIFGNDGCIATMGSNEVPKAHGGTYWADDGPFDAREYALGTDSNDARKRELWQKSFLTQSHRLRPLTNFSFRKPSKIRNSWAH